MVADSPAEAEKTDHEYSFANFWVKSNNHPMEPLTAAERQEAGRKLAVSRVTHHLTAFRCGSAS